jgi:transcriptional/translational regulatory protein YebC/TACO1
VPAAHLYRYHTPGFSERAPGFPVSGHSRWANIQRRHCAQTRRRSRGSAGAHSAGQQLVRFEGYGPGGAAIMVECLTDDRARVAAALRRTFAQHGGHLGADGAVSYLFNTVALLTYPPGTDEGRLMQVALEAGAEDVVPNADTSVEVLADPQEFATVRALLTLRGFTPATAEVTQRAATSLELSGSAAEAMVQLLEALEGLEEVREVYSNVEIAGEVLARL